MRTLLTLLLVWILALPAPAVEGLLLWNRMEDQASVEHSEAGPDGYYDNLEGQLTSQPGRFGNGIHYPFFPGIDGTSCKVAFDLEALGWNNARGCIEFWWTPDYEDNSIFGDPGYRALLNTADDLHHPPSPAHTGGKIALMNSNRSAGDPEVFGILGTYDVDEATWGTSPTLDAFDAGVPVHWALSWDVSGIDGEADTGRLYRDGALAAATTASWTPGPVHCLWLGSLSWCSGRSLIYASAAGVYDNLRIWDHARTSFPDMDTEAPLGWIGGYRAELRHAQGRLSVADGGDHADRDTLVCSLSGEFDPPDWFHCTLRLDYPTSLAPVEVLQLHEPAVEHFFLSNLLNDPDGTLEVSLSLAGAAVTDFTGDLFAVVIDGLSEDPAAEIAISQVVMRQRPNTPLDAIGGDPEILQVDGTAPLFSVPPPDSRCVGADLPIEVAFSDNLRIDRVEYRWNGGGWADALAGLAGDFYAGEVTVPIAGLDDGDHALELRGVDAVGYASEAASLDIHLDTVPPVAPSGLSASPRDHAVRLAWSAGGEHDGYELWRARRDGYPYWGGLPGAPGAWAWIADIDKDSLGWTDDFGADTRESRGVHDYRLRAVDCVHAFAEGGTASATNYFLGDWATPYDGGICTPDLTRLAGCYGTTAVEGLTDEVDVAPTTDWTSFGLPGPDGLVNFEDLIVFAMNYDGDCESPLEGWPGLRKDSALPLADAAGVLRLARDGGGWTLVLDGALKGFSATVATGGARLVPEPEEGGGTLALAYGSDGAWTVDAVALGGLLEAGSALRFRLADDGGAAPRLLRAEGRDGSNRPVRLATEESAVPSAPAVFFLAQNQPNPFNPSTTIRFGLDAAGPVRLTLYNALGQRVRALLDEPREAGEHAVRLDATDLASGLYLYRLECGSKVEQRKMLLLR